MTDDQTPTPDGAPQPEPAPAANGSPAPAHSGAAPTPAAGDDDGSARAGEHGFITWLKKVATAWNAVKVWLGQLFLWIFRAPTDVYEADGSRWPSSYKQFLWDLVTDDVAQGNDGVVPPPTNDDELAWVNDVAEKDIASTYAAARTHRKDADDTTRNLELKAARLATVLVALLTANVALVVFELTRLGSDPSTLRIWLVWTSAGFGLWAAAWLVVGLTRAVDADQRMGITTTSTLKSLATDPRAALRDEVHGREVSNWTRRNKASRLIDARAAVSRSMLRLVISALIAIWLTIDTTVTDESDRPPANNQTQAPATPAPTAPTNVATSNATPTPTASPTTTTPPAPAAKPGKPPTPGAAP